MQMIVLSRAVSEFDVRRGRISVLRPRRWVVRTQGEGTTWELYLSLDRVHILYLSDSWLWIRGSSPNKRIDMMLVETTAGETNPQSVCLVEQQRNWACVPAGLNAKAATRTQSLGREITTATCWLFTTYGPILSFIVCFSGMFSWTSTAPFRPLISSAYRKRRSNID
jgi:hypothetical protein